MALNVDLPSEAGKHKPLTLSLLGPFDATFNGEPISFATDAARALLSYLAVEAGRPHRREHLATLLWPDRPQSAAFTNLRQTLARLRRGLPDPVATGMLEITRQTLKIDPGGVDLDCAQFEWLLATCANHAHRDISRCRVCILRLEQAYALYRGEFLDGVFSGGSHLLDEWVVARREQYHRQVLEALHTLANHYESVADHERMRQSAVHQLTLEPWREEAHRQMMRALALQGQRTAALEQYETCRRILALELGVEPDFETRTIFEHIREDTLAREMLRAPAPVHNLPAQLTPFVGREHELAEINGRLDNPDTRLLTLVGAGGMGKTRLALETAYHRLHRYPDGVFFISLASLVRPDAIESTIAATMGLELTGDIRKTLPTALRDKQTLLVLDNFEHLMEGVDAVVELLAASSGLQFLITSRERLNVLGEHAYIVHGMDHGKADRRDATCLFDQCVRRVQQDFTLGSENLTAVTRICELVEGMPLGLELAAAWVDALPLDEIAEEIERGIDFLVSDWRDTPERHRSLRAVFDGSWRALDEPERQIFHQLTIFQGGFTREAAQIVAGASLRALARLGHKSLLHQQEGRYQIHELLRQFGIEQFDTLSDERKELEMRHSAYFLSFVAQRQTALDGDEPQQAAAQIQPEIDNIEKAWMSAIEYDQVLELDHSAIGLWRFYSLTGQNSDLEQLMQLAADRLETRLEQGDAGRGVDTRSKERILSKLRAMQAAALVSQDDFDAAIPIAEQAIALGRTSEGVEGEAFGYLSKGQALIQKAQYAESQSCLETALSLAQRALCNDEVAESLQIIEFLVYLWLGGAAVRQSDHARARQLLGRSLDICRQRGDLRGEVHCLLNLGTGARSAHEYSSARENYERGFRLACQLGYRWGEASTQQELGDVARLQGDLEFARELSEQALVMSREIGDRLREAYALACLGRVHTYLGDDAGSRVYLDRLLYLIEGIDAPAAEHPGWTALAVRHYHASDTERALIYAQRGVTAAQSLGSRVDHADALVVKAQILAGMNRLAEATDAYQRGLELCDGVDGASEAVTARAGLAMIALDQRDGPEALEYVNTILATLAKHPDGCVDQPAAVYLTCYRVLDALGDPRATKVLHDAHRRLVEYADGITGGTRRRSFLENVTAHRELRQVYADQFEPGARGARPMKSESADAAPFE